MKKSPEINLYNLILGIGLSEEVIKDKPNQSILGEIHPSPKIAIPFYKEGTDPKKDWPAGFVVDSGDRLLVCYRGTANFREGISDIDIIPEKMRPDKKFFVHKGFNYQYKLSKQSMNEAVNLARKKLNNPQMPLTFAGHSMGGAIAQIAALDRKIDYPTESIECVTFGGPKVFAPNTAKQYNEIFGNNTLRVINKYDGIPKVPKFLFAHVGSVMTDRNEYEHPHLSYFDIVKNLYFNFQDGSLREAEENKHEASAAEVLHPPSNINSNKEKNEKKCPPY